MEKWSVVYGRLDDFYCNQAVVDNQLILDMCNLGTTKRVNNKLL